MKEVMLSIQPKWCELIASGKKTVEVRKTKPKIETPFKCYIYCTKSGRPLVEDWYGNIVQTYGYSKEKADKIFGNMQGKVIGEFVCDEIFKIEYKGNCYLIDNDIAKTNQIAKGSCFDFDQLFKFLSAGIGYGWHISNLKIYDEPKKLSEFRLTCNHKNDCGTCKEWGHFLDFSDGHCNRLEKEMRSPKPWCFVEEVEE